MYPTVKVVTKQQGRDVVEGTMSRGEFDRRNKEGEAIYDQKFPSRKPGARFEGEDYGPYKVEQEDKTGSFTAIIMKVDPADAIGLKRTDELMKCDAWIGEIARIYHFYVHGPLGNATAGLAASKGKGKGKGKAGSSSGGGGGGAAAASAADGPLVELIVKQFQEGEEVDAQNMVEHDSDYMSKCVGSSRGPPEPFEFQIKIPKSAQDELPVEVQGVIRYHPFLYDRETHPKTEERSMQRANSDLFDVYWNGRAIPHTSVPRFGFVNVAHKGGHMKKEKVNDMECFNRLSGALFFGSAMKVTTNKMSFMEDPQDLLTGLAKSKSDYVDDTSSPKTADGHHERVIVETRMFEANSRGGEDRGSFSNHSKPEDYMRSKFVTWINECRKLDKQISFEHPLSRPDAKDKAKYPAELKNEVKIHNEKMQTEGFAVTTFRTAKVYKADAKESREITIDLGIPMYINGKPQKQLGSSMAKQYFSVKMLALKGVHTGKSVDGDGMETAAPVYVQPNSGAWLGLQREPVSMFGKDNLQFFPINSFQTSVTGLKMKLDVVSKADFEKGCANEIKKKANKLKVSWKAHDDGNVEVEEGEKRIPGTDIGDLFVSFVDDAEKEVNVTSSSAQWKNMGVRLTVERQETDMETMLPTWVNAQEIVLNTIFAKRGNWCDSKLGLNQATNGFWFNKWNHQKAGKYRMRFQAATGKDKKEKHGVLVDGIAEHIINYEVIPGFPHELKVEQIAPVDSAEQLRGVSMFTKKDKKKFEKEQKKQKKHMDKYATVPENGSFREGWFQMGKQVHIILALYDEHGNECDMNDKKKYGSWAIELEPEQTGDDVERIDINGATCWYTTSGEGGGASNRMNVLFRPEPNKEDGWTKKQSSQEGTSRTIQLGINGTIPADSPLRKRSEGYDELPAGHSGKMSFKAQEVIELYTGAPNMLAFDGDKYSCDGPLEISKDDDLSVPTKMKVLDTWGAPAGPLTDDAWFFAMNSTTSKKKQGADSLKFNRPYKTLLRDPKSNIENTYKLSKAGVEFEVEISLLHTREGAAVDGISKKKMIKVTASKLPSKIKLMVDGDGKDARCINNGNLKLIAGRPVHEIRFEVWDGADQKMDLGSVFDAGWRLDASWGEEEDNLQFRKNKAAFVKGICPPELKATERVQASAVKYIVSLKQEIKKSKKKGGREKSKATSGAQTTIDAVFTVKSYPGEPAAIKINPRFGEKIQLGTLEDDVGFELRTEDEFGNAKDKWNAPAGSSSETELPPEVECADCDASKVKIEKVNDGLYLLTGALFNGKPGERRFVVKWRGLESLGLIVNLVPGMPKILKWKKPPLSGGALAVYREQQINDLEFDLCDSLGNVCTKESTVGCESLIVELKCKDLELQLKSGSHLSEFKVRKPPKEVVFGNGSTLQASFSKIAVDCGIDEGKEYTILPLLRYSKYTSKKKKIQVEVLMEFDSPLSLRVSSDPEKPVELDVKVKPKAGQWAPIAPMGSSTYEVDCTVGSKLPAFRVEVRNFNGDPIPVSRWAEKPKLTISGGGVLSKIAADEGNGASGAGAVDGEDDGEDDGDDDEEDTFCTFSSSTGEDGAPLEILKIAGAYEATFAYNDKTRGVRKLTQQPTIKVTVSAGDLAALIVRGSNRGQPPGEVSVTNTGGSSRTIAENLVLDLVDAHDNRLESESTLSIAMSVVSRDGAGAGAGGSMPQLDGQMQTEAPIQNGSVIIPALLIKSKSTGDDGRYAVRIEVVGKAGIQLEVPFDYSNDQRRVEERNKLQAQKSAKYERLTKVNEILREQSEQMHKATSKVEQYKQDIASLIYENRGGAAFAGDDVLDRHGLTAAIRLCEGEIRDANERSQRSNRNPPLDNPVGASHGDADEIMAVGSFGYVEDDTMCHLISWAMRQNMQTLVVPSPAVANKHSNRFRCLPKTRLNKQVHSRGTERPLQPQADASRFGGDYLINHITFKKDDRGNSELAGKVLTQFLGQTLFFPDQERADGYYKARRGGGGTLYYLGGNRGNMGKIESSGVQGGRGGAPPAFQSRDFCTFAKPKSQAAARANARIQYLKRLEEKMSARNRAFTSQEQIKAQESEEEYKNAVSAQKTLEIQCDNIDSQLAKRRRDSEDVGNGGGTRGGGKRARKGR